MVKKKISGKKGERGGGHMGGGSFCCIPGNIFSVILGQSKCFLATDRYWVTLFQSYWDRANAFLLQTGTG